MTPAPSDKQQLQIGCPSCSQKFKVGPELMGRTVECGSCEARFKVSEEIVVRDRKLYPGERDPKALSNFQRVPGTVRDIPDFLPGHQEIHYETGFHSPVTRGSPFRITMGWLGFLIIVGTALLLYPLPSGQVLTMSPPAEILMALGAGIAGVCLLAFANPRSLKNVMPVAIMFAMIVLAVPFVFRGKLSVPELPANEEAPEPRSLSPLNGKKEDAGSLSDLRKRIGTGPLETEIRRLAAGNIKLNAYGIWLRDLSDSNRHAVEDYVLRATGASPASHIYPRDSREYLMVLTGVDKTIEEIANVTERFSLAQKVHPKLFVVESQVDGSMFIEGPMEKLIDKSDPAFYDLNKRELESIQLERVLRAVKRLADAEPKIYRTDITRILTSLLSLDQVDFPGDICKALLVWAEDLEAASDAALPRVSRLHAANKQIPRPMVELLAKAGNPRALPLVEDLWMKDNSAWESFLIAFGPMAEPGLLERFPNLRGMTRHSAVRILTAVGTDASLPVLQATRKGAEAELVVLIDAAEKAIRDR